MKLQFARNWLVVALLWTAMIDSVLRVRPTSVKLFDPVRTSVVGFPANVPSLIRFLSWI
jgi:hypothetical protein